MLYRRLDSNDDYVVGQNLQGFLSGAAAVGQAVKTRLRLLYGEWWENYREGFPLFQEVLGVSGSPEHIQKIDLLIKERILGTEGVVTISDFESSYSNRSYSFQCTITTNTGESTTVGVSL